MSSKIIASSALLAFAGLAHGLGSANVVNQCNYNVYMTNVPAATSGQDIIGPMAIAPGSSYSQTYTGLSSAGGWSIKLSTGASSADVLQYEYSYPGTGTIYYDLSQINGDPFGSNWFLSASGDCSPDQSAYTYPTDDLAAMQSCPDSSSVTLTLCSSGNGAASSPAPSTFVTSVAPSTASAAPPAST